MGAQAFSSSIDSYRHIGCDVAFFNDDTSISQNMQYEREINALTEEIARCRDSAAYYRSQREAIIHDNGDLEHIAREKFHMQRPSEDVYILK